MRAYFLNLHDRIRSIAFCQRLPIVIITERDLPNGEAMIRDVITQKGIHGVYFFSEDNDNEHMSGVTKRGKSRPYPARILKVMTRNGLRFDGNMFTLTLKCEEERHVDTDTITSMPSADANNAIAYVKFEMMRFGWDEKKKMHHGKWNDENDDTAVALQMLCYWMQEIYESANSYKGYIRHFQKLYNPDLYADRNFNR
jgi:uncharacterized protein YqjF (DUF2071 family)